SNFAAAAGAGPPNSGIQPSCGTARRPATLSGYSATTLAGLRSSSRNVSIAASNLDSRNSETALRMRICVLLASCPYKESCVNKLGRLEARGSIYLVWKEGFVDDIEEGQCIGVLRPL